MRIDYPPPSAAERYCAWYGDERDGVVYFGEAAFWSAMRSRGGDPTADMTTPGPAPIGRFDLRAQAALPPLEVGAPGARSGVWDVLAHPDGRVFFTTFFESAGWVEPASGRVGRLDALGPGLNELELGPGSALVASRYSPAPGAGSGSLVVFDPAGVLLREIPLHAADGYLVAPKTVGYDRLRDEFWVTTDVLPEDPGSVQPPRHDAIVLDGSGRELRRIVDRELQFVAFAPDGTGYRAIVTGGELSVHVTEPGEAGLGRRRLLDPDFPTGIDFVQDIQFAADGSAVLTRWSGRVHVVRPGADGPIDSARLPTPERGGLYYSAFLDGDRVCATLCSDVAVVCTELAR